MATETMRRPRRQLGRVMTLISLLLAPVLCGYSESTSETLTSGPIVTLMPLGLTGYQGPVETIARLSNEVMVVLPEIGGVGRSSMILVNSNGTTRTLLSRFPVRKVRCLDGVIYTLEMTPGAAPASPPAAGKGTTQFTSRVRMYDPAGGTSATIWRSDAYRILDMAAGNQCLYLFSDAGEKEATGTCKRRIVKLPLSPDARPTTTVVTLSAEVPPSNFVVYGDSIFYLDRQRTRSPGFTKDTIYRLNLTGRSPQKVVEDDNITGFCFIPEYGLLAHVMIRPTGGAKGSSGSVKYYLKMRPLEGAQGYIFVGPIETRRWCSDLYYDPASLVVRTTTQTQPRIKEFRRMSIWFK
jgi:hypothetical protein